MTKVAKNSKYFITYLRPTGRKSAPFLKSEYVYASPARRWGYAAPEEKTLFAPKLLLFNSKEAAAMFAETYNLPSFRVVSTPTYDTQQ